MPLIARLTGPWRAVPILGLTQIIGWGSTFYAIAVLKGDIAAETGWSPVMAVAGRAAWWMPHWLDRLLPGIRRAAPAEVEVRV